MSNREKLRDLVRKYPDWTNKQYAEHLGQGVDTIRGALSVMGLSRYKTKPVEVKKRVNRPKPAEIQRPTVYIASKAGSTRFGYLKLM